MLGCRKNKNKEIVFEKRMWTREWDLIFKKTKYSLFIWIYLENENWNIDKSVHQSHDKSPVWGRLYLKFEDERID